MVYNYYYEAGFYNISYHGDNRFILHCDDREQNYIVHIAKESALPHV